MTVGNGSFLPILYTTLATILVASALGMAGVDAPLAFGVGFTIAIAAPWVLEGVRRRTASPRGD